MPEEVDRLAQILTPGLGTSDQARRTLAWSVMSASLTLGAGAAAALVSGPLAWGSAALAVLGGGLTARWLWSAAALHSREAVERMLLLRTAAALPPDWYLLTDVRFPAASGEGKLWAAAVGPAGMIALTPCTAGGCLMPAGSVWISDGYRAIPSPAEHCLEAVEAIRALLPEDLGDLPVWPMVVLTDVTALYHPAETGTLVVGAPTLERSLRRLAARKVVSGDRIFRLAAGLAQLCR